MAERIAQRATREAERASRVAEREARRAEREASRWVARATEGAQRYVTDAAHMVNLAGETSRVSQEVGQAVSDTVRQTLTTLRESLGPDVERLLGDFGLGGRRVQGRPEAPGPPNGQRIKVQTDAPEASGPTAENDTSAPLAADASGGAASLAAGAPAAASSGCCATGCRRGERGHGVEPPPAPAESPERARLRIWKRCAPVQCPLARPNGSLTRSSAASAERRERTSPATQARPPLVAAGRVPSKWGTFRSAGVPRPAMFRRRGGVHAQLRQAGGTPALRRHHVECRRTNTQGTDMSALWRTSGFRWLVIGKFSSSRPSGASGPWC